MLRDLAKAVRVARRNPCLALAVVLLSGVGVGANAAVFTVARSLVFRPLPFAQPERLVSVWRESRQTGASYGASWPHLAEWRRQAQVFEDVQAYIYSATYAAGDGAAEAAPISEFQVTQGFLPMLGVRPALGRLLSTADVRPISSAADDSAEPILVSDEFWRQRLSGRPDVLGRLVVVGASSRIVVGVLPRGVRVLRNDLPEIFSPLRPFPDHESDRSMTYLQTVARLRAGTDLDRARAELEASWQRAETENPRTDGGLVYRVQDMREHLFGPLRPTMTILLAGAGVVLLTACGNLAILLTVRVLRRRREIAIRLALGGGRPRVAVQLVAESLVLSLAGGAAGLLLAGWAAEVFSLFSSGLGLGLPHMAVDRGVLVFTLVISLATGALFGIAPVLRSWRIEPWAELRGGPTAADGRGPLFLGGTMAVAEVAFSMILLSGAALLLQGFARINRVDPGFHPGGVVALSIGQAPSGPDFRTREAATWSRLLERSRALPGVAAAAFSGALPLASRESPENMKARVTLAGRDLPAPGYLQGEYQDVSPGYFRTMGIPLISGRDFEDRAGDGSAAIINESFSREWWGPSGPIGAQISVPGGRPYTVVGVVGDVRQYDLRSMPPRRQIYRPLLRGDVSTLRKWPSQYLVVKTSGEPARMAPALRDLVTSVDPRRQVISCRTLEGVSADSTAWERVKTDVVAVFALMALLLAVVGLYAILSHAVSRRRREIAIRVALGGRPRDIHRLMLWQGAALIAAGIAAGTAVVLGVSPLVASQVFDLGVRDLLALVPVAVVVAVTGLAACYLPIRDAVRTDPVRVWQAE